MRCCFDVSCPYPAVDGNFCRTHLHDSTSTISPVGCASARGNGRNVTMPYTDALLFCLHRKLDDENIGKQVRAE